MKVDLYTKSVLTVIALCLLYIVAKDVSFVPETHAQDLSVGFASPKVVDVNIVGVGGTMFRADDIRQSRTAPGGGWTSPCLPVRIFGK